MKLRNWERFCVAAPCDCLAAVLDGFSWDILAAPAMLAFGFGLSRACYQWPLNRAKKDLCRILRGELREIREK